MQRSTTGTKSVLPSKAIGVSTPPSRPGQTLDAVERQRAVVGAVHADLRLPDRWCGRAIPGDHATGLAGTEDQRAAAQRGEDGGSWKS